jgi:hypothetical protein
MESLTFDALGGQCELYGIDVDASSLRQGPRLDPPDARPVHAVRGEQ